MQSEAFWQTIRTLEKPVIVDFWAPWCMPCRLTKPLLEELAQEFEGQVHFLAINTDEAPHLARELGIMSIPTLLVFEAGEMKGRYVGAQMPGAYRSLFESLAGGQGITPGRASIAPRDRLLRAVSGLLLIVAAFTTQTWWLALLGSGLMFWGVYDRCAVWQAIQARWRKDSSATFGD